VIATVKILLRVFCTLIIMCTEILITLYITLKGKTASVVTNATVHKEGSVQRFSLLAELNFHSASGLDKHITRSPPIESDFLINVIWETVL
jgi:hypothetical protein